MPMINSTHENLLLKFILIALIIIVMVIPPALIATKLVIAKANVELETDQNLMSMIE